MLKIRYKIIPSLTLFFFFKTPNSFSQQWNPNEIFSKEKRVLPAPPPTLTSQTESLEKRIRSEANRFERSTASDKFETQSEPQDNSDLYQDPEEKIPQTMRRSSRVPRKENRAFSLGFVGASSYGIFGIETNLGLGHPWEIGGGIGTGFKYTTWGLHFRHYFFSENLSPFFQAGYANWRVRKTSSRGELPQPNYLSDRFFENKSGEIPRALTRHLLSPGVGVLFQDPQGIALSALLQYLIALNNFSGALYGGAGIHLYF